jgi:hypothetical protein
LFLLLAASAAAQDVTLQAPDSAVVGAPLEVRWEGGGPQDFITIVAPDAPEGRYEAYQYARQSPVTLTVPPAPGRYEIRYLAAAAPYPTLARRSLNVTDASVTLKAPASVAAGADIAIEWNGPDHPRDFITVVPVGTPEGQYGVYTYTEKGSPLTVRAPDATGDYEIRYLMGSGRYRSLGSIPIAITGTDAALEMPATVAAGAAFDIRWQGPDNVQDFIAIVPAGAPPRSYDAYVYTARGNPVELNAPEEAGDYEVRYLTGQTYATLASAALTVTPVSATLDAPPTAAARDAIAVTWQGPGNPTDYVVLLPVGSDNHANGNYALVTRGETLRIATPAEPGDYELRYVTAGKRLTLGKRPVTIVPRPAPGELLVVDEAPSGAGLAGATVAIVLDASGSMLQRLDGQRRIDLAKAAVSELIDDVLPDSVAIALRVFGHKEADSCRSDLEIPVGPLNRSAASGKVASIEAMNLARTPIADSLRAVAADVSGRSGPLLIILLTDGEETCDGDPASVIRELAAGGTAVRVNIVGFAIDELMLQETFSEWARLGNGKYFNASDAAELAASLRGSLEVPFSVVNAHGNAIATGTVNGPPVSVDAGTYRIALSADHGRSVDGVVVRMEETTRVTLGDNQ